MTITDLRVRVARARYAVPFAITGGTTATMESLLVGVTDGDGISGVGEVNPMPAYSGISTDAVHELLETSLRDAVIGSPVAPGVAHSRMDAACSGPAARLGKAAIDIALHDLLGRRLGVPVSTLLGGAHADSVPLAWVVGLRNIAATLEEASARHAEGYGTIKLKIGRDPERDIAAVRAVRAQLPNAILRLDANGGYDPDTAVSVLNSIAHCEIELVEQPVASGDPESLRRVRRATGMRVIADESFQTAEDVARLIRADACDGVNIKITKPGGLHRARQVAGMAEAAGLSVMIGSMPEMGVATAAGLHFAQSLPTCEHACELIGPAMIAEDVIAPGSLRLAGGTLALEAAQPGLGVSVAP